MASSSKFYGDTKHLTRVLFNETVARFIHRLSVYQDWGVQIGPWLLTGFWIGFPGTVVRVFTLRHLQGSMAAFGALFEAQGRFRKLLIRMIFFEHLTGFWFPE